MNPIYQGTCIGGPLDGKSHAAVSRRLEMAHDGGQGVYYFLPSKGPDGPAWNWVWTKQPEQK